MCESNGKTAQSEKGEYLVLGMKAMLKYND